MIAYRPLAKDSALMFPSVTVVMSFTVLAKMLFGENAETNVSAPLWRTKTT